MDNQESFHESKCDCEFCKEMNETNKNWDKITEHVKPQFKNTAKRLNEVIKKYESKYENKN